MTTNSGKRIFLHLSDIHFVKNFSEESSYDLDSAIRHAIEQDAETMFNHLKHVDGILISGDIAFAGKVEEYEIARTWLVKLSAILHCDPSYVWCVPGNHDVDQSVQTDLPSLFDSYDALRKSKNIDEFLQARLTSRDNGPLMFQPLKTPWRDGPSSVVDGDRQIAGKLGKRHGSIMILPSWSLHESAPLPVSEQHPAALDCEESLPTATSSRSSDYAV